MLLTAPDMALGHGNRSSSVRSYLLLLALTIQLPFVALAAVLSLQQTPASQAWAVAAGLLLLTGLVLAVLVARRVSDMTGALMTATRAVAKGEAPATRAIPIRELNELAETIAASGSVRREIEGRLRAGEARLATLLAMTPIALIAVDAARRVTLFNRTAEAMFGCTALAAIGSPADRFFTQRFVRVIGAHLDGTYGRLRAIAAGAEGGGPLAFRGDGTEFAIDAQIARVETPTGPRCLLAVRDVSEDRRHEDERAALLLRARTAQSEAEQAAQGSWLQAEASRMLALSLDHATTLGGLARLLAGTLCDWCAVDVVDDDGEVRRAALVHVDPSRETTVRSLQRRITSRADLPAALTRALTSATAEILEAIGDGGRADLACGEDQARLVETLGARTALIVPLVANDQPVGVLTLVRASGEAYAAADLTVARDLADRVAVAVARGRQHRAVDEERRHFAELFEGLGVIVWEADAATLDVTQIDRRVRTLFGYPDAQWSRPGFWRALIHPDDRERTLTAIRERIAAGQDVTVEYRLAAADGRMLWIEHLVHPVREVKGPVARVRGVMRDVTGRRREAEERERLLATERSARAEAEAAAQRARFLAEASDLLTSSLDHSATLDSLVRLAVPAVADWCLVHLTEPVGGRRLHAAGADAEGSLVAEALERLAPALELQAVLPVIDRMKAQQPLLLADIGPAWLEGLQLLQQLAPKSIIVVPMIARGRPIGTLTFIATRPERRYDDADLALARELAHRAAIAVDNARAYAEAEGANRAKDQFLATLSHELRTPLTAMLGWVLMLQSGRLRDEEATAALASIERNTRLQAQLINDLLDISRIVAGKLQLDRRPVDLRVVIDHALDSVRRAAESKRLTVECAIAPAAAWVPGDAVRLEQVVVNLLGNAVKFTPEGGHIDVRLDADESVARLTVSDTGQGIEPTVLPHVFDSFRQADSSSTRRHGGLGLGLAIVRRLVVLHQGEVEAASEGKDRGATFTVRLPLLPEDARPAPAPAPETRRVREEPALPRLDRVRVLVVDDDDDSRRFVASVLGGCGAEVREAASVGSALDVLARTYVDVLVSDIGMPGSDGYDLVTRVRAMEREHGGRIPAVALTAYASEEDRDRALAAGFSVHVPKPVSPGTLARAVRDLLAPTTLVGDTGA
jgi:PAS domain S-box-containing protein